MTKTLCLALLAVGCSTATIAQSTLTAANFNPMVGDGFINHICDTAGITAGAAGAGLTWDYSALITTSVDTGVATACSATANCVLFPGSSYAIVSHATTLIPYYIASSNKLQQDGYYEAADTNAVYSTPIDQFHYPFTYNTTFSAPYAGIVTLGAVSAHETGTITVTCDGYGTLKLPGGITETNVLRVTTSQLFADSANLFGTPLIETFQLVTVSWYMPGYHSPLLSILTTTQVGGTYTNKIVSYAPVQFSTAGTSLISGIEPSLRLFPDPATNELNIQYYAPDNQQVRISLYDLMGKEIATVANTQIQGQQNIQYNTAQLPKGIYLLHLSSGTETITKKIEVL